MRPLVFALAVALSCSAALADPARVIDGDTLELDGERIRLHGIDAPEMKQTCEWPAKTIKCGVIARAAMLDLVTGAEVTCKAQGTDRYGRTIAICHADGFDIGWNMVYTGWALAYRKYSERYVPIEDNAREAKRGLWKGEFEKPWDWREERRK